MIKRIIFDVDNVLIPWKDEYDIAINEAFEEIGYLYDQKVVDAFLKARNEYEKNIKKYSRKDMIEYINSKMERKLPYKFIDLYIKKLGNKVPDRLSKEYYNTLEYLSKKYELVVLTNWFEETQIERLKKLDIFKYFKAIYTGEEIAKPYKQSFKNAMGDKAPEECAMIGDNIETDISGAINGGIGKAVWLDIDGKKEQYLSILDGVVVINDFSELNKIF